MKAEEVIEQVKMVLNKPHGGCTCYICNLWRKERIELLAFLESVKVEPEHVTCAKKTIAGWPKWKQQVNCNPNLIGQQQEIERLKESQEYLEQCLADKRTLTKEISDILHPDNNGPKQPSLCDVVRYVRDDFVKLTAENKALAGRNEKLEKVIQRCLYSMQGSNCLEEQWLEQAICDKEGGQQ